MTIDLYVYRFKLEFFHFMSRDLLNMILIGNVNPLQSNSKMDRNVESNSRAYPRVSVGGGGGAAHLKIDVGIAKRF